MELNPLFLKEVSEVCGTDFLERDADLLKRYGGDWTRELDPCPSALARPGKVGQLADFLKICSKHRAPVVPSGGRTGLAAGAVAARGEVVVNLERMNFLGPVDRVGRTVRVGAGAVTEAVRHHCELQGLTWPVRFASEGSSQIGGNLATNAGGIRVIRYGSTRHWVMGMQVVLMSGEVLELGDALEKDNSGLDLKQIFVGSEGILGFITEATLRLTAIPPRTELFFFALEDIQSALHLMDSARNESGLPVAAFEVMGASCVELVGNQRRLPIPCKGEGDFYALVEVEQEEGRGSSRLESWVEAALKVPGVQNGVMAQSAKDDTLFWAFREGIAEALAHLGLFHKNDVAVPLQELESFLGDLEPTLRQAHPDLELYVFGHLGDGNLHLNVVKPEGVERTEFLDRCAKGDEKLFSLVERHRGSISAEHGIGILKRAYLHHTRSPREIELMRGIKKVFDPLNLMNPGKVIPE